LIFAVTTKREFHCEVCVGFCTFKEDKPLMSSFISVPVAAVE
jgi:hypothetical protein